MLINFVLHPCGQISHIRYLLVLFYYLTSVHSQYKLNNTYKRQGYHSNLPSIKGFVGTLSFSILSLLKISAECTVSFSSLISIPISFFITSLPSLAPTSIIWAFWKSINLKSLASETKFSFSPNSFKMDSEYFGGSS